MDKIKIKKHFNIVLNDFPEEIKSYLVYNLGWLKNVERDLKKWCIEEDNRDYFQIIKTYFYLFTIPSIEVYSKNFYSSNYQKLIVTQFWLGLHVRFLDDVIDNDNGGIGFENSLFLSHLCLQNAQIGLLNDYLSDFSMDYFWNEYHRLYSFQLEMIQPFQEVSFLEYTQRHWERGSLLFLLPNHLISQDHKLSGKKDELFEYLKAYFDFTIAPIDLIDIFSDYRNAFNTPATLLLNECSTSRGFFPRVLSLNKKYWEWLENRYEHAYSIASKYDLIYTKSVLVRLKKYFSDIEKTQ